MTFTPHSCINLWRSQISQCISISLGTLQWTHHRRECYTDHPSQEIKHEIYDYPWGAIYLISKRIQLWGIGYTRVLCIHKLFFTSAGQPSNCRDTWKQVFLSTKNFPQEATGLLQHIWDVQSNPQRCHIKQELLSGTCLVEQTREDIVLGEHVNYKYIFVIYNDQLVVPQVQTKTFLYKAAHYNYQGHCLYTICYLRRHQACLGEHD